MTSYFWIESRHEKKPDHAKYVKEIVSVCNFFEKELLYASPTTPQTFYDDLPHYNLAPHYKIDLLVSGDSFFEAMRLGLNTTMCRPLLKAKYKTQVIAPTTPMQYKMSKVIVQKNENTKTDDFYFCELIHEIYKNDPTLKPHVQDVDVAIKPPFFPARHYKAQIFTFDGTLESVLYIREQMNELFSGTPTLRKLAETFSLQEKLND